MDWRRGARGRGGGGGWEIARWAAKEGGRRGRKKAGNVQIGNFAEEERQAEEEGEEAGQWQ